MRLTVLINKETTVNLARTIEIPSGSFLFVKKAAVYWNHDNVCQKYGNDVLSIKGKKTILPTGYYTFAGLVRLLDKHDVTLTYNASTLKSTIKTANELKLRGLGPLLGFGKDAVLAAGSSTESPNMIEMNNGLRHVSVSCSMVDTDNNFGITGNRSDHVLTLPITTDGTLKGSVTHFSDIESRVPLSKGFYPNVRFGLSEDVGSVLLEIYVEIPE
jgi:hypothetical protein